MGFYNLISATKLSAVYDYNQRVLTLTAEGKIQEFTSGITFQREPFMGGLKFRLGGWTGPLTGKSEPYTHKQNFPMQLPSPVFPSNTVIIVDANNPNGKAVKIEFLGMEGMEKMTPSVGGESTTHQQLNSQRPIVNPFGRPFEIRQKVPTTTGGSATIEFDHSALKLVNTMHENGDIVWTFTATRLGHTQAIVTVNGGIATYIQKIVYNVDVIAVAAGASNEQLQLSFLGMVNIAVNKVRAKYPNAQLYEVDAFPSGGPTTNPQAINEMKVVFQVGNNTAIISSTSWGEFGPIEYIQEPWLEDVVIPWPIQMTLEEANALLKEAGYTGPFRNLTLRWPLYPGVHQPSYIFGMVDGGYVFVGVYDKKVSRENVAMQTLGDVKSLAKSN